ncbi:hypothetical protein VNO80_06782 [Phaseolus coccineus]|uniref:Uncharacterized protein n=1 Tax=Phaseolus coccineus TaxID=3886 RepID=A0AAN9NIL3_PHACN
MLHLTILPIGGLQCCTRRLKRHWYVMPKEMEKYEESLWMRDTWHLLGSLKVAPCGCLLLVFQVKRKGGFSKDGPPSSLPP